MNVLSINMCGLRDGLKRRRISNLCSEHSISFLGVQETRVTTVNLFELKSLRGNFNFDFAVANARGLSGGLVSLWDPAAFLKEKITCTDNMIIVEGQWVYSKLHCFMINVYAPQSDVEKREL